MSALSASPADILTAAKADYTIIEPTCAAIESCLNEMGKKDQAPQRKALEVVLLFAKQNMVASQAFLVKLIPAIGNVIGSKNSLKETRADAELCLSTITSKMSPNAVREVLPMLFDDADPRHPWQKRAAALNAVASFANHAPEQLGHSLPETITEVGKSINDLREQVTAAAKAAMVAACEVVGNRDIEPLAGDILRSITNPEETEELMHKLAGVTFVQSVESPALAMVTPLLLRGLRSSKKATIRQSAVIIENMSKLVDDAMEAAAFVELLLPVLEKATEACADPEARTICERSLTQIRRLNTVIQEAKARQQHVDDQRVLNAITEAMEIKESDKVSPKLLAHIASLCCSLMFLRKLSKENWQEIHDILSVINKAKADACIDSLRQTCSSMTKPLADNDEEGDDAQELCNCNFTLAYGTKILLHNTSMRLKRGAKYGLLGGNDSGKTTLMRAIANGTVEGFPDPSEVRTVFVEADILGELSHLTCVDYIMADPRLKHLPRDEVLVVMASVGFTEDGKAKPHHPVSSLSGGWRMKLAMARAMLQKADILLLDEPTNHLDVINVKWVKNYINSLHNVTAIMVSHDSGFLRDCCTDILQINRLKLRQFKGNLDAFIAKNPEATSYFNIKESKLTFNFPQPGPIEGIKSRSRALMKMTNCTFTYPSNKTPTLFNITVQVSMASRVGCVGENGAGKSTMIKLLTGEILPQEGEVWKHPNARVAYVPQHAFHHIEQHLDKTPNEYIRWRYEGGEDKESLTKVSMVTTPEEEKLRAMPWETKDPVTNKVVKRYIAEVTGYRREVKKEYFYECRIVGEPLGVEGTYVSAKDLIKLGWEKEVKAIDARIAQSAGMFKRTLSASMVEKHLADVGLEAEFASHYRMSALSGGQKVKVVMAAALWNSPHILILDEPTNYLDRESLGALAHAIESFLGGVVIISHHNEFVSTICTEEWVMDAGHLTTKGESGWMNRQDDKIEDQAAITEMVDAVGNTTKVKVKKVMSKREEKVYAKAIKTKIDAGVDLDDDENDYAIANNIY